MLEYILTAFLFAALVGLIYFVLKYAQAKQEVERRARQIFERWRSTELESRVGERAKSLFQTWILEEEQIIRKGAIKKSQAVIRGKITEHLIPFFPDFAYDPKDVRFIGTPIDLVVFDGLSEGKVRRIVFVEVKSGKRASLSTREGRVIDCIKDRAVFYEILHRKKDGDSE